MSLESDRKIKPPVDAGTVVAGKYRVGDMIAAGGMGIVMRAKHLELDHEVAIKFLHPDVAEIPSLRERFLREARAAARLRSDHVVRVFDVGLHGQTPYMVMEYLIGSDLGSERAKHRPIPIQEAVDWMLEALDAVAEAHEHGIVHRDLKPSNLFLVTRSSRNRPRMKVLDFGISKVESEHVDGALTGTGLTLGSPSYMSPEQVRDSRNVDARSDVWSMGVILWELLTGESAFPGLSVGDIFAKIREESLPPLRSLRPEVAPGLEAVVSRCVERDREKRFPNASALRDALAPFGSRMSNRPPSPAIDAISNPAGTVIQGGGNITGISGVTTVALDPAGATSEPEAIHQETAATWSRDGRPSRRSLIWYAGGIGLVATIAVLALAWSRVSKHETASPALPESVGSPAPPVATPQASPMTQNPVAPLLSAASPTDSAASKEPAAADSASPRPVMRAPLKKTEKPSDTTASPQTSPTPKQPVARPKDDLGI